MAPLVEEADERRLEVGGVADGELLFSGTPAELETTVGESRDFETAFVRFLHAKGH